MHEDCVYLEDKLCSIAMVTYLNILMYTYEKVQIIIKDINVDDLRKFSSMDRLYY